MIEFLTNIWTKESAFRSLLMVIGGVLLAQNDVWMGVVGAVFIGLGGGIASGAPKDQFGKDVR